MTTRITKPILDSGLMRSIEKSVIQFSNRHIWKDWGLNTIREQGAALLFHGPSGTGKTITARWLAKQLDLRFNPVDYSEIGAGHPGELARNIKYIFASSAPKEGTDVVDDRPSMIFLDECDTMLVSRKKLAQNTLWMLEPINQLLVSIRKYRGLVVLATNAEPEFLDSALETRLLAKFEFTNPKEELTRVNLWKSKWPGKLPVQPDDDFFELAAKYPYNGHEVEQFIMNWSAEAIRTAGNGNLAENLKIEDLTKSLIKSYK